MRWPGIGTGRIVVVPSPTWIKRRPMSYNIDACRLRRERLVGKVSIPWANILDI